MKTKKIKVRQGFTIVELVIVIGVIGVLTAVLVPTFINLNKKAEEASNQSFVKNLNTQMAIREQEEGKNVTMFDAVVDAKDIGFDVEKLTPVNGRDLVWDSRSNRFALLNTDGTPFYTEGEWKLADNEKGKIWKIYDAMPSEQTYSIYAKTGWASKNISGLKTGFDAGYNRSIESISYENTTARETVIRTQGDVVELTVNGPSDHIEHYGYAKTITVTAVNSANSYHEYGTTSQLVAKEGKIVIENTGVVFDLKKADGATASFENKGGNIIKSDVESIPSSNVYNINNLAQFKSFRDVTNSGVTFSEFNTAEKYISLNADIVLDGAWAPISNYSRNDSTYDTKAFAGRFVGNNHTIKGLTTKGITASMINTGNNSTTPTGKDEVTYGLFGTVNNAKIESLNLVDVSINNDDFGGLLGDAVGGLLGFSYGITDISGVKVSGSVSGYDGVGGIVGKARGVNFTIKNSENRASVSAVGLAAGIVGQFGAFTGFKGDDDKWANVPEINNCVNYGTVTTYASKPVDTISNNHVFAAGIVNLNINKVTSQTNSNPFKSLDVKNCTNNGKVENKNSTLSDQLHQIVTYGSDEVKNCTQIVVTNCKLSDGTIYNK
ncbi:MAG: type II secretion system protein [Bacilli bacterium]|nr:type II secretion system protein [Bacilli bacterium]